MRKSNQFLAVGSVFIILLVVVAVAVGWQYIITQRGSSNPLQPTTMTLTGTCRDGWQQVPMVVTQKSGSHGLHGVAALSQKDVWAVGDNLIEHWNGTQWSSMRTLQVQNSSWTAISARSSNDIWVIGRNDQAAQALHWNGTTWTPTAIPTSASGSTTLSSIAVIAPDNAWIAGTRNSGSSSHTTSQPLLLHWDGKHWNEVAGAGVPLGNTAQLSGISAASATDIWAVGSMTDPTRNSQEFIEHWNGKVWQQVPPPPEYSAYRDVTLQSVVALSPANAWAVGTGMFGGDPTVSGSSGLVEHWDGLKWNHIQISEPESKSNRLVSIKVIASYDIWAVGSFTNPNTRLQNAYLQHVTSGSRSALIWPTATGQSQKNASVVLTDIAGTPDGHIIAVGSSTVFTQNPPIDNAAHNLAQPLVLARCS